MRVASRLHTYRTYLSKHYSQLFRSCRPGTSFFFTTLFQDGAGKSFVPHEAVERVSAAASVPVYGFLDQYLGRGIVGGSLYSVGAHGAEAANLVLRILAGTSPPEATLEISSNKVMFDWRRMQRWGISEHLLPAGGGNLFP